MGAERRDHWGLTESSESLSQTNKAESGWPHLATSSGFCVYAPPPNTQAKEEKYDISAWPVSSQSLLRELPYPAGTWQVEECLSAAASGLSTSCWEDYLP